MKLEKETISFGEPRKILLILNFFRNLKISFRIKDDHTILLIGEDANGDINKIGIKTKNKLSKSYDIYYVSEGKKMKGKMELSKNQKCLESLQFDSLSNVMVDQWNLYLYGVNSIDGQHKNTSNTFLTLAEIETLEIVC